MNDDVDISDHIQLIDDDFSSPNDATLPWPNKYINQMESIESPTQQLALFLQNMHPQSKLNDDSTSWHQKHIHQSKIPCSYSAHSGYKQQSQTQNDSGTIRKQKQLKPLASCAFCACHL